MKVAVLCEFSGTVRDAFLERGHDAISCDLLPTEVDGPHIVGDCTQMDWSNYDLIIAHPPCTYLTNSGVRWLHTQNGRWELMLKGVDFFNWCLSLPCERTVIENPIMHGHAQNLFFAHIIKLYNLGNLVMVKQKLLAYG